MRLEIPYGDGFLPLDTGMINSIEHLNAKKTVTLPDLSSHLFNQIESSGIFNRLPLDTANETDIVLVFDNPLQCAYPNIMMDAVFKSLQTRAIPNSSLSIILLLPPYSKNQLDDMIKSLVSPRERGYHMHIHDNRRRDLLHYLGDTPSQSVPVYLNSLYTTASLKILISTTMPSIFTGGTGGASSISLGLSGQLTSMKLQKIISKREANPTILQDEIATTIQEVVEFCPPDLSINTVQDNYGNIAQIMVGDVNTAWHESNKIASELSKVKLSRKADIAIVGAGGRGFDGTLYDAVPSIYAGLAATRTGGTIILIAECPHGPGYEGFLQGIASTKSEKEVEILGETNFKFGMERSRFFWRVLESRNLIICSRLRASLVTEKLHATAIRDPQEGLDIALRKLGADSKIVLIENGSNLVPISTNEK